MSVLAVEGLSFSYGRGPGAFSLRWIDLALERGGLLGVLGPNGSGKSTLLRLICRSLTPDAGRILLDGADARALKPAAVARRVALVPQELSGVFAVTVEQMVALGRFPRNRWFGWVDPGGDKALEQALRLADLWHIRERLVSHLSGGERRRVLLARALAQEPDVLLLDEPTTHLDPRHQVEFIRLIEGLRRERGVAVVAVLHDLNLARAWCPDLLLMKDGTVVTRGRTDAVFTAELVQRIYGVPAAISGRHIDFFYDLKGGSREP